MQFFKSLRLVRTLAVGVLAAFVFSLVPNTVSSAAILFDNKTRNRAQKAMREGDFDPRRRDSSWSLEKECSGPRCEARFEFRTVEAASASRCL